VQDNCQMNSLNAFAFAALGLAMRVAPWAFPALFPHSGANESSTSALWMAFMGAMQVGIGVAYLARAHAFPLVARLISSEARGAASLPAAREPAGR
jgi:hypothetical protein